MRDKNGCNHLVYVGKTTYYIGAIMYKNKLCIPSDGNSVDDWYHPVIDNANGKTDWNDSKKFRLTKTEVRIIERQKVKK